MGAILTQSTPHGSFSKCSQLSAPHSLWLLTAAPYTESLETLYQEGTLSYLSLLWVLYSVLRWVIQGT